MYIAVEMAARSIQLCVHITICLRHVVYSKIDCEYLRQNKCWICVLMYMFQLINRVYIYIYIITNKYCNKIAFN